ncbi:protein held out wings isoform X2 [Vanessa tameamea]|uniref:Protein held out wings isoform X2 n=1 Tax=Vanessa tameamea TaxID=334116 RepID=A0A8B8HM33_VANTA|nr:protein held out wings isoform X2 [Vanessa tameamea]XP_046967204.1 protein held out wings isoform X1 [Vanessa cardui]XP_046967205.1 protein held out wings isoform X1 [Vanessa cardui]XP_047532061.1 protein held out wings isoform X2 [Vanessa atalanta]
MCDNTNPSTQSIADYLAQLLKDRKQLAAFPNVFMHMERLLDEEIAKVRASLFQINGVKKEPLVLPEPEGMVTTLTEKVYVPVKEHPDFNFVGRILGPRGMTAKQLEQETGCKIMVRGKGSMRDKKKEDANRGKPNWEHLADDLHVLLTVEDTENRAKIKLARAVDEVKRLLVPQADGEDELKKRQLMELAIINGTYRDSSTKAVVPVNGQCLITDEEWRRVAAETQRLLAPTGGVGGVGSVALRTSAPLGAPLILSPRIPTAPGGQAGLLNGTGAGAAAGLLSPGEPSHQLIYASPYADYANYAALTAAANPLLTAEYAAADHTGIVRRAGRLTQVREHPYQRTALPAP